MRKQNVKPAITNSKKRFWERNPWFSSRVQEYVEVQGQNPDFASL